MKRRLSMLLLLLLTTVARADAPPPEMAFQQARQAYEAGDFATAALQYEDLIHRGYDAAQVYFNLGNARFREGRVGPAIASYQRALYRMPRHPDIRANLDIVRRQTGALRAEEPFWMEALGRLSEPEWRTLGLAGYWLAGGAGAWFLLGRRRRGVLGLILLGLLLAGAGGAGWARWHALQRHPEAVVAQGGVQARFAPLDNALPHFALPEGSLVRVRETAGPWIKIEVARQEGWIRSTTCDLLSPP